MPRLSLSPQYCAGLLMATFKLAQVLAPEQARLGVKAPPLSDGRQAWSQVSIPKLQVQGEAVGKVASFLMRLALSWMQLKPCPRPRGPIAPVQGGCEPLSSPAWTLQKRSCPGKLEDLVLHAEQKVRVLARVRCWRGRRRACSGARRGLLPFCELFKKGVASAGKATPAGMSNSSGVGNWLQNAGIHVSSSQLLRTWKAETRKYHAVVSNRHSDLLHFYKSQNKWYLSAVSPRLGRAGLEAWCGQFDATGRASHSSQKVCSRSVFTPRSSSMYFLTGIQPSSMLTLGLKM